MVETIDPFSNILTAINESSKEAVDLWKQHQDPQVYKDWSLSIIDLIAKRIEDPDAKFDRIKSAPNNIQIEPQESEDLEKMQRDQDIDFMRQSHMRIVPQMIELLVKYVKAYNSTEHIVENTEAWLKKSQETYKGLQEHCKNLQSEVFTQGMQCNPSNQFLKQMDQFLKPQEDIQKAYEENRANMISQLLKRQSVITKKTNKSLEAFIRDDQVKPITSTRELLIYEGNSDSSSKEFKWQSTDQEILSLTAYCSPNHGINGIQANLNSGQKTQIFGKRAYLQSFTITVNLPQKIEVISRDWNKSHVLSQIQFNQGDDATNIFAGEHGNQTNFDVHEGEEIIGFFGRSFDDLYNCFKSFGFILGKRD